MTVAVARQAVPGMSIGGKVVRAPVRDYRWLELQTLRRLADWTGPEWSGLIYRATGLRLQQGPVVALELGDRAARQLIGT